MGQLQLNCTTLQTDQIQHVKERKLKRNTLNLLKCCPAVLVNSEENIQINSYSRD